MDNVDKIRLEEIKGLIKKQESKRTTGIVLIIISLFCLWPLMIVGIVLWVGANKEINNLLEEEKHIKTKDILNTTTTQQDDDVSQPIKSSENKQEDITQ